MDTDGRNPENLDQLVEVLAHELERLEQPTAISTPSEPLWLVEISDPSSAVRTVRAHVAAADPKSALLNTLQAVGPWMEPHRAITVTLVPLEELPDRTR